MKDMRRKCNIMIGLSKFTSNNKKTIKWCLSHWLAPNMFGAKLCHLRKYVSSILWEDF